MSPRKSSTSSARPVRTPRPRYLGLEVAGEHLPSFFSPRDWEGLVHARLARQGFDSMRFRIVRSAARRAIVEVGHLDLTRFRSSFAEASGEGPAIRSVRTWGTLVGAKAWLRGP